MIIWRMLWKDWPSARQLAKHFFPMDLSVDSMKRPAVQMPSVVIEGVQPRRWGS